MLEVAFTEAVELQAIVEVLEPSVSCAIFR